MVSEYNAMRRLLAFGDPIQLVLFCPRGGYVVSSYAYVKTLSSYTVHEVSARRYMQIGPSQRKEILLLVNDPIRGDHC